ncbi:hypothetical protein EG328_003344 [Venturia inaequalis]|uniref:Uncharacterized protein n=1 Tax=Venturia inaequalis TaxID=5025 RepID=A0A8H3VFD4_VENIN|nr:hypothetical protein EG328_003344 [Venturia inaequalis]
MEVPRPSKQAKAWHIHLGPVRTPRARSPIARLEESFVMAGMAVRLEQAAVGHSGYSEERTLAMGAGQGERKRLVPRPFRFKAAQTFADSVTFTTSVLDMDKLRWDIEAKTTRDIAYCVHSDCSRSLQGLACHAGPC